MQEKKENKTHNIHYLYMFFLNNQAFQVISVSPRNEAVIFKLAPSTVLVGTNETSTILSSLSLKSTRHSNLTLNSSHKHSRQLTDQAL